MPFPLLILLAVTTACVWMYSKSATADASNSRSDDELPALSISYADLQEITSKAVGIADKANGEGARMSQWVTIESGDREVRVDPAQLTTDRRVPRTAHAVTFTYWARDTSPISDIKVEFDDLRRAVSVGGQDAAQVDALFASLREDILHHSVMLGGLSARSTVTFLGRFVLSAIALGLLFAWLTAYRHRRLLAAGIWCAVVAIGFIVLPLDRMLAGFVLTSGDPSFLVRYGPEISLLSLIFGPAVPLAQFIISRILSTASDEKEPTNEAEQRYLSAHGRIVETLTRRPGIVAVRNELGHITSTGDELFDAILAFGSKRVGISTFRSSTRTVNLRLYIANAAGELYANRVQTVVVIFFKGERDEELRRIVLQQLVTYVRPVRVAIQVLVVDPERIDEELVALKL